MVPRILIDAADLPGGGRLRLIGHGADFSIMLGGNELMSSRVTGSERALAELGCAHLPDARNAGVLIGGLGMGFTLRAALAMLAADATVEVAELVPAVIGWARGPLAAVHGCSLADPRVTIVEADVAMPIRAGRAAYDAILLDVDNGPDGLTQVSNDWLYSAGGLAAARSALRPGGVLAIWSSAPDARFTRRLRDAEFDVQEQAVRSGTGGRGARHTIWLAKRRV